MKNDYGPAKNQGDVPSRPGDHSGDQQKPSKLQEYTLDDCQCAIDAIRFLIEIRDRCRKKGLIDW